MNSDEGVPDEKNEFKRIIPFSIKIEEDLLEIIKGLAKYERRSVNQQIIKLIQEGLECRSRDVN